MNLQVTARRFKLSERLVNMVEKEVAQFARHFDQIRDVNVVLTTDHGVRHVDITVHVPNNTLSAHVEGTSQFDFLIPQVSNKTQAQLQRYKEKLKKL